MNIILTLLLLFSFVLIGHGQNLTDSIPEPKKNILSFTKNKNNIPINIFIEIGIDSYEKIAGQLQRWNKTDVIINPNIPRCKLNWALSDINGMWLISISYGGRSFQTKIFSYNKNSMEDISNKYLQKLNNLKLSDKKKSLVLYYSITEIGLIR